MKNTILILALAVLTGCGGTGTLRVGGGDNERVARGIQAYKFGNEPVAMILFEDALADGGLNAADRNKTIDHLIALYFDHNEYDNLNALLEQYGVGATNRIARRGAQVGQYEEVRVRDYWQCREFEKARAWNEAEQCWLNADKMNEAKKTVRIRVMERTLDYDYGIQ